MALGSTHPLTEMSTRSIYWGKGGRCVRLTTYHHPVPLSRNLGTLTSWNPLGLSRPVMGLLYLYVSETIFRVQLKHACLDFIKNVTAIQKENWKTCHIKQQNNRSIIYNDLASLRIFLILCGFQRIF